MVAAGGGGGGGGSGLFYDLDGGSGGTNGDGAPGSPGGGGGGAKGDNCAGDGTVGTGGQGDSAGTASGDGGGGGGGGGTCAGHGGQSGGAGGGGGGGSGNSTTDPSATDPSFTPGTNTGDGSVTVTFTQAPQAPPALTPPGCQYAPANSGGVSTGLYGNLSATGVPAPTLALVDAPVWLTLGYEQTTWDGSTYQVSAEIIYTPTAPAAPGEYAFTVEAYNSQGVTSDPIDVVAGAGIVQPAFLSVPAATATVGTPFSFQATEVGCPAPNVYSISFPESDTSSWLSIDPATGVLSGTPAAADVGTHTFTITAASYAEGSAVSQKFSLRVSATSPATPIAPTIGQAVPYDRKALVAFTPPVDDGGAPVTSYTVTATDHTTPANGGQTATAAGSPTEVSGIFVTGLTNGDHYTFTVAATNKAGTGDASAPSNDVVPFTFPSVPSISSVTPGPGQATVNFNPPVSPDGGVPIASYTVTATDQTTPGNGGQAATGAASPITVSGLTNGDSYTFTVTAANAAGTGGSSPSTPANTAVPIPPGSPSADLSVTISPHPSAADGSTFTETVTVSNHGPWPAASVLTGITIPSGLTLTADPGGTKDGPVVSWTAQSIGVNSSVTYTITVQVNARARGTVLIAAASVSLKVPDPRPLNNAALITVKLG
jgi:hypothetical protein